MFKKILFVFVLAAAVLTFAGYSVPTASACSTLVPDDCRPIFGPNFDAIQAVPSGATLAPATSTYMAPLNSVKGNEENAPEIESTGLFPQ